MKKDVVIVENFDENSRRFNTAKAGKSLINDWWISFGFQAWRNM